MKTRILSLFVALWTTWSSASIIDRNPPVDNPVPTPQLTYELKRRIERAKESKVTWEVFMFNTRSGAHNYKTGKFETEEKVLNKLLAELGASSKSNDKATAMNRAQRVALDESLRSQGWTYVSADGVPNMGLSFRPAYSLEPAYNTRENIAIPGTNRRETIREYYLKFSVSYDYQRASSKGISRQDVLPKLYESGTTVFYCTEDAQICWNHGTYFESTQIYWSYPPNYEGAINSAGGGGG